MFFRKSSVEPLPVTMSAVGRGDRVLQIGVDDPAMVTALAAKAGMSGLAVVAVPTEADAEKVRTAGVKAGVLLEVHVASAPLPIEDSAFDIVVVHRAQDVLTAAAPADAHAQAREWRRALRPAGRVVTIESYPAGGIGSLFAGRKTETRATKGALVGLLEAAGFRPVRALGEREGLSFAEGLKSSQ
jgi:SAM-dependent methyltransferase